MSWFRGTALIVVLALLGACLNGVLGSAWDDTPMSPGDLDVPGRGDVPRRAGAAPRAALLLASSRSLESRGRSPLSVAGSCVSVNTLEDALAEVARARGEHSFDTLEELATTAADARVQNRALAALAELFGERAWPVLLARTEDGEEKEKVREEAARLVGRTGLGAGGQLECLIESELPYRVRRGAVRGLAEASTAACAAKALALAADTRHPLHKVADSALARMYTPEAAHQFLDFLGNESSQVHKRLGTASRAALCRSLGRAHLPEALRPLEAMLVHDPESTVRAAAAHALGVLGADGSFEALQAARQDPAPAVAREVRIALARVELVRR